MNKKLALQKLAQIRDNEHVREKRKLIAIIISWLKFDKPFSLSLANTIIKEYN